MNTWTLAQSAVCYVPFGHAVDHLTRSKVSLALKVSLHEHNGFIESIIRTRTRTRTRTRD